ncbi:Chromatin assembly factor 1 subunit A [Geodia barretti]|uniref:Chromatin assembly factor 1 subunit A n=1 Tax=Geodia barretti TaxID=519541 RepID=A0AA35RPU4_GEOBA|nr:Chromatin assembly factor 1 subunit A [Geodia barretti]
MNVADSVSPTADMECRGKGVPPTDVETPSSLLVSSETACGLKQIPPLPPTNGDTPTATPTQQQQLECVSSNGSPPQSTAPPTTTPMEIEESGETSCEPVKSTSVAVSETLTKVKKTKALRLERERLRAEAQAVREEERLRKEEARLKRELEKKARRERREQEERARQERKEAREREKREKQEKKETERRYREEEEKKRREEKQRAELEKQLCAEEKIRKQHKLFSSFFSKLPKTEAQTNGRSENERRGVGFDASVFDGMINSQTEAHLSYLTDCRSHRLRTYKPRPAESDDVIITSSPNAPPRPQMKLLQFHSNVRPPYFGSWRKKSEVVSGRAPFRMDKSVLDYEFDSDDEWEEEEPGESVSSASEGEESGGEESGGEEEGEDGFFVPHGYLSEDEGERSESEEGGGLPGTQMDKVQAKARAWEAEFQRTCHPKKPVCIGCVWVMGEGEGGEGRREDQVFLSKLSALVLTESPVRVEPLTPVTTIPTETHASSVTDNLKRPVPEEAMPDLIRLVHQSTAGLGKLVKMFQAHWGAVLQNRGTPLDVGEVGDVGQGGVRSTRDRGSPPAGSGGLSSPRVREAVEGENHSGISKRQLEKKIQQIAVKELRPPSTKQTWYVHDAILEKYKIDGAQLVPLFPPTPKSCLTSVAEKSCSPEASLSTPVSKKRAKRRAAGNTPTLFEVIAKSPQATSSATAPAQKRLKLVPSPARSAAKSTGDSKPPKKRIRLESLSLRSPLPPVEKAGASGSPVIIIDDTSTDTSTDTHSLQPMDDSKPSTNTTVSAQPMDNSTPSTTGTVSVQPMDDSKPSTSSTVLVQPIDNSKPLANTTISVQPTDNSKPSTNNITTPLRKAQIPVKRLPQIPAANQPTPDTKTVFADTKCLQEVTNSQKSLAGTSNSEDGGKNGENRPHVDWQKLLSASSSNCNKVMVIADMH